jgi:hypothetical protein
MIVAIEGRTPQGRRTAFCNTGAILARLYGVATKLADDIVQKEPRIAEIMREIKKLLGKKP